jgi:hypothetical protein
MHRGDRRGGRPGAAGAANAPATPRPPPTTPPLVRCSYEDLPDPESDSSLPLLTVTDFAGGERGKEVVLIVAGEGGRELVTSEVAFWLGALLASPSGDDGPGEWAPLQSALKAAWRAGWAQGSLDDWVASVLRRVVFKIVPVANILARKAAEHGDPCSAGGPGGAGAPLGAAATRIISHLIETARPQAVVSLRSGDLGVHLPQGHPAAAAANEVLEKVADLAGARARGGAGAAAAAAAAVGPDGPLSMTWHLYGPNGRPRPRRNLLQVAGGAAAATATAATATAAHGSALDAALGRVAAAGGKPVDIKTADGALLAEEPGDPRLPGSAAAKAAAAKPGEGPLDGHGSAADADAAAAAAAAAGGGAAGGTAETEAPVEKPRNVAAEKGTVTDIHSAFRGPDGYIDLEEGARARRAEDERAAADAAAGAAAGAGATAAAAKASSHPPPPRCARDFGPMDEEDYQATVSAWLAAALVLGDHVAAHPRASAADAHAAQESQPEPRAPPTKQDLALRGGAAAAAAGAAGAGVTARSGAGGAGRAAAAAAASGKAAAAGAGADWTPPRDPAVGAAQAGAGQPDRRERGADRAADAASLSRAARAGAGGGQATGAAASRPPPAARRRPDDDPRGASWLTILGVGACAGAALSSAWRAWGQGGRGGHAGGKARAA